MKVLAFGASNSANSINKKFATYAAFLIADAKVKILDLNDFEMPLFSVDREAATGHPEAAQKFLDSIALCDLLIISLAEHNGSYSASFKNILDWASRVNGKVFQNKPMLLLSTSPGARGASSVMDAAKTRFPFHGARIISSFSLPEFGKNYSENAGIIHPELKASFESMISEINKMDLGISV
ncbi:MAG: NAD(P)H-dependent oxidoreductase [Saprospiraceae bacterium]|nr:NAD(P)H-dependent oxidoreductase [Saprospiraceae bacterium]